MMKSNQALPISLALMAALFGALANFYFKRAASQIMEVVIWKNLSLFFGLLLFTLVLVLLLSAFRLGGNLLVVYPTYATTYVWALLISIWLLNEQVSMTQVTGIGLIIFGVVLIGLGAS